MSERHEHIAPKSPKKSPKGSPLGKPIKEVKNWARELLLLGALGVAPVAGLAGCATPEFAEPNHALSGTAAIDSSMKNWQAEGDRLSRELRSAVRNPSNVAKITSQIIAHEVNRPSERLELLDTGGKKIVEITTCRGDLDASSGPITLATLKATDRGWAYQLGVSTVASDAAVIGSLSIVGNDLQVNHGAKIAQHAYSVPILLVPEDTDLKQKSANLALNIEREMKPKAATFVGQDNAQKNCYVDSRNTIAAIGSPTILATFTQQPGSTIALVDSGTLPHGVEFDPLTRSIQLTPGHTLSKGETVSGQVFVRSVDNGLTPVTSDFEINILEKKPVRPPELDQKRGLSNSEVSLSLPKGRSADTIVAQFIPQADVAYVISNVTSEVAGITSDMFAIAPNGKDIIIPAGKNPPVGKASLSINAIHSADSSMTAGSNIKIEILPVVEPVQLLTRKNKNLRIAPAGTLLATIKTPDPYVTIKYELIRDGESSPKNDLVVRHGDSFIVADGKELIPKSTYHLTITLSNGKEYEYESVTIKVQ